MPGPRNGPCSPWTSAAQVQALPWVTAAITKSASSAEEIAVILAQSAVAASELLYERSGRVFTGECGPVTIRPVSRPTDADTRSGITALAGTGWFSASGMASGYGTSNPGVMVHYGSVEPPTIILPHPVTEIVSVLIDGVTIPGPYDPATGLGEWELRDFRELVRIRPTAAFSPTERWGWPTSQILDLPDSQEGTFSITFTFGQPPPMLGQLAALKLAEYLALPQLGDTTHYPRRVKQVARQGVTTQTADASDMLAAGQTGIYEVDLFLLAVNPKKLDRQATVWSPDVGRARRQATPSLPSS